MAVNGIAGITGQIRDALIQQSLQRKLRQIESTEVGGKGLEGADRLSATTLPSRLTSFREFPGYQQVRLMDEGAKRLGVGSPFFKVHDGRAGAFTSIGGRDFLNFSSYNYLGLSGDARVNQAAKDAIDRYGTSVSASRLVSGERPVHQQLESEIARVYGVEAAIGFVSGHAANVTTIGHLFGPRDLVLHDELIHNSVLLGIQLSGAKRLSFTHNDLRRLDHLLREQRRGFERVLIVTEGVFSMDGDFPDLPQLIEIKRRHQALLMVDEAHSFGVMGSRGFGIREHFGVDASDVDIWMGTLSKALASCGGYIAGESALIENLRYLAPGFLYSVGMPPPVAAAALAALRVMQAEPARVTTLQDRGRYFVERAKTAGIDTGTSTGFAVVPAIVGGSLRATRLSGLLAERGINVQPILHPAVPEKSARLRFFISFEHSEADIDRAVSELDVILQAA